MSAEAHYEYRWEDHSLLTRYLSDPLFVPLVRVLPRRITPNMVTVFGHAVVWLTFVIALPRREPGALMFAALGIAYITYAILDCIDGMFARYTQRTSRVGELLDHGFDAITLPLVSLGIGIALSMPSWLVLDSAVVSHNDPARPSCTWMIRLLGSSSELAELKTVNRIPSKRTRPSNVAAQM